MALSPGTQLDSCEIIEPIGSGGMGEVYRGRDTKLGRDVAVKALPDAFAKDPERLARFTREAQVLASLNHPNIAVIHELKHVGSAQYLILELVDGETLAELIARGPVPLDEALKLARQIAEALEAAHDKGIVHRDLKPANVKVMPDGRVKVLDFGLAKIHESQSSQVVSRSPTLSALNTAAGVILGTAAYMAPEQARGKAVDRRADVWAFGCVLFEVLTGRKTFKQGETVSDTLAGILALEPEWHALPADVPPRVRALLERCLRKDPARRLQDMGNARIELEEAHSESEQSAASAATGVSPRRRYERLLGAVAALLAITTAALGARLLLASPSEKPVRRFETLLPNNLAVDSGFHVSPDGRKIAFATSQPARIWVRALSAATAEAIPSTEGTGSNIFWSADSKDIGFFAEGKLKRVAAAGGPAQVLSNAPAGGTYFGTWNAEGVILFASDAPTGGHVLRVSAGGGEAAPATELDASKKETSHRFPQFLPDGRHYLYIATGADARDRAAYVGDLNSKDRRPLPGIAAEVKYSSSGHLVFIRDGALMAQGFDATRLELSGAAFTVADPFAPPTALTFPFSLSATGTLVYRTSPAGGASGVTSGVLVWYDAKGARREPAGGEGEYRGPELSPDGKSVAFARGAPGDVWLLDIANARTDRLTSHGADDANPRWSPDAKSIAFDSARDGASNLYQRAVGVVAEDELLLKTESAKTLSDWTRDGKYLVYTEADDIWALPLPAALPLSGRGAEVKTGDAKVGGVKPIQVTKTAFVELTPRVSPDGRWVAYASNEPGEYRIYVQSFPDPGAKQPVSTAGGLEPRWSRDGRELFYYTGNVYPYTSGSGVLVAASINVSGSTLTVGAPAPRVPRGTPGSTSYSVTTDGRFLVQTVSLVSGAGFGGRPVGTNREFPVMTVILNWAGGAGRARGAGM